MVESRLDRELETREKTSRKRSWVRPEVLPSPKEHPDWAYRWIRVSTQGQSDPANASSKFREGWEPTLAKDHPEIVMFHTENDRYKDNIVMGGLMLCRAPKEMVNERNNYYAQQADAQIQSVDNNLMRESDRRMPLFNERKTEVTFGKGK